MSAIQGFAPYLPAQRPHGTARWWIAEGNAGDGQARIASLREVERPPPVNGTAGLAAPCSLPREFRAFLGLAGDRPATLEALAACTPRHLSKRVRAFAMGRQHGKKHPERLDKESLSALDRRRLPLFHAALPLLRSTPTYPWADPAPPYLCEVDVVAFLVPLDLPGAGLAGDTPAAVRSRVRILQALQEGVCGFPLDLRERDFAVAARPALDAVIAFAAAAWLRDHRPPPPPTDADAWIPTP